MKKVLAIMLSFLMLISLLPMTALAEGTGGRKQITQNEKVQSRNPITGFFDNIKKSLRGGAKTNGTPTPVTDPVCFIDLDDDNTYDDAAEQGYATLQGAINALPASAADFGTVVLLKNVNESIEVKAGRKVIIDLNAKCITGAGTGEDSCVVTVDNAELSILNSNFLSMSEEDYSIQGCRTLIHIKNAGVLKTDYIICKNDSENGIGILVEDGDCELKEAEIVLSGNGGRCLVLGNNAGTVKLKGSGLYSKYIGIDATGGQLNTDNSSVEAPTAVRIQGQAEFETKLGTIIGDDVGINADSSDCTILLYGTGITAKTPVMCNNAKNLTIDRAVLSTKDKYAIKAIKGAVTVNGIQDTSLISGDIYFATGSRIQIKSIGFNGKFEDAGGSLTVYEGLFNEKVPEKYLAEGRSNYDFDCFDYHEEDYDGTKYKYKVNVAVASIGEGETKTIYSGLQEAIVACSTEATTSTLITMLNDTTELVEVKEGQKIVIDFNGHTLSAVDTDAEFSFALVNAGDLTIKEGIIHAYYDDAGSAVLGVTNLDDATLIIDNMSISASNSAENGIAYAIRSEGTLYIINGTVYTYGYISIPLVCNPGTEVTVYDGKFSYGLVNVEEPDEESEIFGSVFSVNEEEDEDPVKLKVYGGLFSEKVDNEYLGDGAKCEENNDAATKDTYPYVVNGNKVARIGVGASAKWYESLWEAIKACQGDQSTAFTIKLLSDTTEGTVENNQDFCIGRYQNIILDLNGHTLTVSGTKEQCGFINFGILTVKNGKMRACSDKDGDEEYGVLLNYGKSLTLEKVDMELSGEDTKYSALKSYCGSVTLIDCIITVIDTEDDDFSNKFIDTPYAIYLNAYEDYSTITIKSGKYMGNIGIDQLSAMYISGLKIDVSGGLFRSTLPIEYLAEGCAFIPNSDAETSAVYPIKVVEAEPVAEINWGGTTGIKKYNTLMQAIMDCPGTIENPAETPVTITLLRDAVEYMYLYYPTAMGISEGKNIILDLNGKILMPSSYTYLEEYGLSALSGENISNMGTLALKNGTLKNPDLFFGDMVFNSGALTVDNVTIDYTTGYPEAMAVLSAGDTLKINNSTVTTANSEGVSILIGISNKDVKALTISDSNLKGHIYIQEKLESTDEAKCNLTITNTNLNGDIFDATTISDVSITVNSGLFTYEDIDSYVPEESEMLYNTDALTKDTYPYIVRIKPVAKVGETEFDSFEKAVEEANKGTVKTIKLLRNIEITDGDYTISGLTITESDTAKLVIKGGTFDIDVSKYVNKPYGCVKNKETGKYEAGILYRYPVYKTAGNPASGIKKWLTGVIQEFTEITDDTTELKGNVTGGWYVVTGSDVNTGELVVTGNVKIILTDGAKLTADASDSDRQAGIKVTGDNSLTIYGQKEDTGILNATGSSNGAGIGGADCEGSNITINGGTINATGGGSGAGIGGAYVEATSSNITINGGNVTATGQSGCPGIGGGNRGNLKGLTINGGNVVAIGSFNTPGIGGGQEGFASDIIVNGGIIEAVGGEYATVAIGSGIYSSTPSTNIVFAEDVKIQAGDSADSELKKVVHSGTEDLAKKDDFNKPYIKSMAHVHEWTYKDNASDSSVSKDTITATCKAEDHIGETSFALKITAPTILKEDETDGTHSPEATLSDDYIGEFDDLIVSYRKKNKTGWDAPVTEAPTSAGTYEAFVTVTKGGIDYTASVEYTIESSTNITMTIIGEEKVRHTDIVTFTAVFEGERPAKSTVVWEVYGANFEYVGDHIGTDSVTILCSDIGELHVNAVLVNYLGVPVKDSKGNTVEATKDVTVSSGSGTLTNIATAFIKAVVKVIKAIVRIFRR